MKSSNLYILALLSILFLIACQNNSSTPTLRSISNVEKSTNRYECDSTKIKEFSTYFSLNCADSSYQNFIDSLPYFVKNGYQNDVLSFIRYFGQHLHNSYGDFCPYLRDKINYDTIWRRELTIQLLDFHPFEVYGVGPEDLERSIYLLPDKVSTEFALNHWENRDTLTDFVCSILKYRKEKGTRQNNLKGEGIFLTNQKREELLNFLIKKIKQYPKNYEYYDLLLQFQDKRILPFIFDNLKQYQDSILAQKIDQISIPRRACSQTEDSLQLKCLLEWITFYEPYLAWNEFQKIHYLTIPNNEFYSNFVIKENTTFEELTDFLYPYHTSYLKYFKIRPASLTNNFGCNIFGKTVTKPWFIVDFDNNGLLDLCFSGEIDSRKNRMITIVMSFQNNKFKKFNFETINGECNFQFIENGTTPLLIYNHSKIGRLAYPSSKIGTFPKKDTLIFKYGDFINYAQNSYNNSIEKLIFVGNYFMEQSGISMSEVTFQADGTVLLKNTINNFGNNTFHIENSVGKIDKKELEELFNLITYNGIETYENKYDSFTTHASTATLKIQYDGQEHKEIIDVGMRGTATLSRIYQKIIELSQKIKWEKID